MMLLLLLPFILYFTLKTDFSTQIRFLKPGGQSQVVCLPNQTVLMSLATNTRTTNVRHFVVT